MLGVLGGAVWGVGGGWRRIRAPYMMWDAGARGWGPGRPVVVAVAREETQKRHQSCEIWTLFLSCEGLQRGEGGGETTDTHIAYVA